MKNTFIDLLLNVTEAMLGAISVFQKNFNIAENKTKFTIPQTDLACLFYIVWQYVVSKIGPTPEANSENLFLMGLNSVSKGGEREDWSDFVDSLTRSDKPFEFLQDKFEACNEQAFFDVDSSKLSNGKIFIDNTILSIQSIRDIRGKLFPVGQVNSHLIVFLQILLIVNRQKFSINQRINSYLRLFLLFYDGKLINKLRENSPSKGFECINQSEQDKLKGFLTNKSGNNQFRAISKFIFGEITPSLDEAINTVAGRCYQLGKIYYENIRSLESKVYVNVDADGVPSIHTFCGFFYLFDYIEDVPPIESFQRETSEEGYKPGKKYDNFYYWVSKAKYNYPLSRTFGSEI